MTAHTNATGSEPSAAPRMATPAEVRKASAFIVGFIAIVVVGYLWAFGAPYSNWFYAVLALGVLPVIYLIITGKQRNLPRSRPLEKGAALREAVVHGIASGLLAYAFVITLTGAFYQWPLAMALSVMVGVQTYDAARGKKESWRNVSIVAAILVIVLTAVGLWMTTRN